MKAGNLAMIIFGVVFDIVRYFVVGFVIQQVWAWFILPVFCESFSLRPLVLVEALGIALFIAMLGGPSSRAYSKDKRTDKDKFIDILTNLIMYIIAFGVCWIIHLFMPVH